MPVILRSSDLEVVVAPERGADIRQVTDLATGTPVFAVAPTADSTTPSSMLDGSMTRWLNGYPGGWQLLAPNAGPARRHDGVEQGYHGESALSQWETVSRSDDAAVFEARLTTAPLALRRSIQLTGPELVVTDSVTNLAPDPVSTRLLEHPAFGAPFLDEHSYLVTDAGVLVSDAEAPGTLAHADAAGIPTEILTPGPVASSIALPGPGSRASLFAGLAGFAASDPSVLFASPTHGFGMRLSWERDVFPFAWLWIEANAGEGWPWFRRMYAIAVEPGNVLPGEGIASNGMPRGGVGATIEAGATLTATLRLQRVAL